ncbi:MAG: N-glycosylase/DNA lyase [Ignisphaera sp.]
MVLIWGRGLLVVNSRRVDELAEMVRAIGLEKIVVFEDIDPQFEAIKNLSRVCGSTAYLLAVLNSVISYRLSQPGEVYWSLFSDYAKSRCRSIDGLEKAVGLVKEFARMYNRVAVDQKLRRLEKIARCSQLEQAVLSTDLEAVRREIALCLDVEPDSKTVVFSAKMVYYVHKALSKKVSIPMTIPIPVDTRVAAITYLSGAIDVVSEATSEGHPLLKYSKTIRGVWMEIGRKSSTPPLNLDALIWHFGKYHNAKSIGYIYASEYSKLRQFLTPDEIMLIIRNLFYRLVR